MLPVGTVIQLQDATNKMRLISRVIGWSKDQCMMVDQPTVNGQSVNLAKDITLVGRGMNEGRILGFQAKVLFQTVQPFRILYLTCPSKVEELSLRKSERIDTELQAYVSVRKHDLNQLKKDEGAPLGVVRNISLGGCNLVCPYRFEVDMPVFLSFDLPDGKTVENVMGFVRNLNRDPKENSYGIQFEPRSESLPGLLDFVNLATRIVSKSGQSV